MSKQLASAITIIHSIIHSIPLDTNPISNRFLEEDPHEIFNPESDLILLDLA
jgi:hypothetical protein